MKYWDESEINLLVNKGIEIIDVRYHESYKWAELLVAYDEAPLVFLTSGNNASNVYFIYSARIPESTFLDAIHELNEILLSETLKILKL